MKKILLIVTGSISAYKSADLVSKILQAGFEVEVVASVAALKFVGEATFTGLTGRPIHKDLWDLHNPMAHINLVKQADLVLVYPASADYLNKLAAGFGDTLETALFLAHDFKTRWWIAPAMNQKMYAHPATQSSLLKLAEWGVQILPSPEGALACGEIGPGRLLEPSEALQRILDHFKPTPSRHTVVITSGGTMEEIDDVRVMTNRSTGKTGALIAEACVREGFDVVYLHGENSEIPKSLLPKRIPFTTTKDLREKLLQTLAASDPSTTTLIHAAAVSDFTLNKGEGKIDSTENFVLNFVRAPKIINELKEAFPKTKVAAFKLTSTSNPLLQKQSVEKLFNASHSDVVIHNDAKEWKWGEDQHSFRWFEKNRPSFQILESRNQLADKFVEWIKGEGRPNDTHA